MRKKKQSDADKAFDEAFYKLASNIQFNIMDLGKMRSETLASVTNGEQMEAALLKSIAKYRQN